MQNNTVVWRASNPLFFICVFMLLGMMLFHTLSPYLPVIEKASILVIVFASLLLLCLIKLSYTLAKLFQLLPILLLILWGFCIAASSVQASLFNVFYNASWMNHLRLLLLQKLDHSFIHPVTNAFVKTLLFGTKSEMSPSLTSAYQTLGILHIIAISGMHLDILFGVLKKVTSWLSITYWSRLIQLILLLMLVWTYTCIAHAGPSIVRASLFFSLILLGRFFKLNLFSFNVISAGILLALLYNSHIITSIGLQLSYAAVIGIYFFYKPILQMVPMENMLLKIAWSNLAVSIAAQLTTLPIILFYFHKSSSLSILGNFLFVPASNLLLYGLMLFMMTPNLFGITQTIANWMHLYIEKMNGLIQAMHLALQTEDRNFSMGWLGLTFYYFCLFIGYYWLQHKAPNAIPILLLGSCLYSLLKLFSI
jgi:ComEC/Rec2-related protein